jgi:hypothetical protein
MKFPDIKMVTEYRVGEGSWAEQTCVARRVKVWWGPESK